MTQYVPSPAHEFRIGVSFPSERRPATTAGRAPNAPAVAVTITSARSPFRRLTAFCQVAGLPPSDW